MRNKCEINACTTNKWNVCKVCGSNLCAGHAVVVDEQVYCKNDEPVEVYETYKLKNMLVTYSNLARQDTDTYSDKLERIQRELDRRNS